MPGVSRKDRELTPAEAKQERWARTEAERAGWQREWRAAFMDRDGIPGHSPWEAEQEEAVIGVNTRLQHPYAYRDAWLETRYVSPPTRCEEK